MSVPFALLIPCQPWSTNSSAQIISITWTCLIPKLWPTYRWCWPSLFLKITQLRSISHCRLTPRCSTWERWRMPDLLILFRRVSLCDQSSSRFKVWRCVCRGSRLRRLGVWSSVRMGRRSIRSWLRIICTILWWVTITLRWWWIMLTGGSFWCCLRMCLRGGWRSFRRSGRRTRISYSRRQ